jgi:hypothetical protein
MSLEMRLPNSTTQFNAQFKITIWLPNSTDQFGFPIQLPK